MASSSNTIVPSSSSSSSRMMPARKYYDVFVSFRGQDTRYNFTDHLFAALQRKAIFAFRDDEKLKKGEFIAPELLRAIEGSQIFAVVFSKNYASSTWCLRELEHILYCVQVSGKRVLPIFYDVDPSEVRKQSGSYAEAFEKHEERFTEALEMVQKWRAALTQVANLSGWDVRDKPQNAEIEKIVEEIINTLGHKFSSPARDLVGLDSPIRELEKHLLLDSAADDVRVVGVCGMGGIGKTTLANVLYGRISDQFDACCVIDDVSKIYREDGPIGAQKQILSQTLGEEHLQICNPFKASSLIQSTLYRLKALIILDNIDHFQQLEKLAMNRECLGAGSRVIIISRDEHILKEYGVDVVYKVPLLNHTSSLQLFCRKAFKCANIMSNYDQLAYGILSYANGLPLAIKVLGSFLVDRDISEWRSALARLSERPNKDIMDVLRLSFDGLEEMEKEIFLDIACFYNLSEVKYVKNVLDCCGFHPDVGLRVLIDKSLISFSQPDILFERRIHIHGLLQELGIKIVKENSTKELRKWSRLWDIDCLRNVISDNTEKNVEAVVLNWVNPITMMAESFSKMSNLRLLILLKSNISGTLSCLSNELRYIEWEDYPFMYLPSCFQPHQLVELYLSRSSIKQLWEGKKNLPNLRTLDLSYSKNLIEITDFGEFPNLEWLSLEGCVKLLQIDPSIGLLTKLVCLNLKYCKNLVSIPNNILDLCSLKYLYLRECSKVFSGTRHLKKVGTSESLLHSKSRSSIFKWITLPFRSLQKDLGGSNLEHDAVASCFFSSSLPNFSCLRELDISFCGLGQTLDVIGCLHGLESLNLGGNNFVTLPSLKELSKLVYLNLEHCKQLKFLPELPSPELPLPELPLLAAIEQYHQALLCPKSHTTAGLFIFNCPELGEGECCSCMTFSWMIRFIQANQESFALNCNIGIVIPGSEIPSWFRYQSVGDSISANPYAVIHDNNFIGVACCVIFSVAPNGPTTSRKKRESIGIKFRKSGKFSRVHDLMPVILDRDLIDIKSNHLWVIYFTREVFFDSMRTIDSTLKDLDDIKMEACVHDGGGLGMMVTNCGYHWVYKQDLQQFNSTMMQHSGNSSVRKRKFLAIEDESQLQPQSHISLKNRL